MDARLFLGPRAACEFQPVWERWATADPGATLMETPRFASFVLAELPSNYAGGVAVATEGGEPAGLLPFRFQRSLGGIPTRRLQTWGLGARAPGASLDAVHAAVLRAAATHRVAALHLVAPVDSGSAPRPPGFVFRGTQPLAPKPGLIPIGDDWEAYLDGQPKKFRKLMRYTVKKATAQGWALRERHDHAAAIELANHLNDRWQNHHYPQYRGRYRARQRDASLPGLFGGHGLRVFALERGDEVASVLYGVTHHGTLFLLRQGNAPEALAVSPSTTLRCLALEQVVGEGVHTLDVVGGTEGYWKAEHGPRHLHVLHRRGLVPGAQRLLFEVAAARKRSPAVRLARAALARVVPRIAHEGL